MQWWMGLWEHCLLHSETPGSWAKRQQGESWRFESPFGRLDNNCNSKKGVIVGCVIAQALFSHGLLRFLWNLGIFSHWGHNHILAKMITKWFLGTRYCNNLCNYYNKPLEALLCNVTTGVPVCKKACKGLCFVWRPFFGVHCVRNFGNSCEFWRLSLEMPTEIHHSSGVSAVCANYDGSLSVFLGKSSEFAWIPEIHHKMHPRWRSLQFEKWSFCNCY